jgi:hypothetical protein
VGRAQDADRDATALFDRDFKCDIPDGAIGCDALALATGRPFTTASTVTSRVPLTRASSGRQAICCRTGNWGRFNWGSGGPGRREVSSSKDATWTDTRTIPARSSRSSPPLVPASTPFAMKFIK